MSAAGSPPEWIRAEFEEARRCGQTVLARGAGRRLGQVPDNMRVLPMQDFGGILDFHPEDLTVEVAAGTSLAALNAELEARGQWFPVGLPDGDDDTLGGLMSMGLAGLLSGYGAVRDRVLGLRAVTPAFGEVRLGAGVVKSVAGYNMPRLYWGSRGAFGVVVALTLKLAPRPKTALGTVVVPVATDAYATWWPDVEAVLDAGWPDAHAEVLIDGSGRTLRLTAPIDVLEHSAFAERAAEPAACEVPGVWAQIPVERERTGDVIAGAPPGGGRALLSLGSGLLHVLDRGSGPDGASTPWGPGGRVFGGPPAPTRVSREVYRVLRRFQIAVDPDGILPPLAEEGLP